MKKNVRLEVETLIKKYHLNCTIEKFQERVNWNNISECQNLSEEFIREFQDYVNWPYITYSQKLSEDFIKEFQDYVNWQYIPYYQKLSEDFIRKFQHRINWVNILAFQKLSEDFIREFKDKGNWNIISRCQKLSENFIREFKNTVNWTYISEYQNLSEDFIREFKNYVDWYRISISQNLSPKFRKEFTERIDINLYNEIHRKITWKEKRQEMRRYAKEYNLKFDGKYLYAYRNHDQWGRGEFRKTISYEKGNYYRDWHCDMRFDETNSFGLGIWPKGNTPVKVDVKDWGVWVPYTCGKCRVWGFTVIGERKDT